MNGFLETKSPSGQSRRKDEYSSKISAFTDVRESVHDDDSALLSSQVQSRKSLGRLKFSRLQVGPGGRSPSSVETSLRWAIHDPP